MKNLFFLAAVAVLVMSGCSRMELAGVSASKYQEIGERFSAVEVEGRIVVEMSGTDRMIGITADANILPYVEVYVRNNTLFVGYDDSVILPSGNYETLVTIPSSGDLKIIRAYSSAVFRTDMQLESLSPVSLSADSWSRLEFSGISVNELILNLSANSDFTADMVSVSDASFTLTGSSSASMNGVIKTCRLMASDFSSLSPLLLDYGSDYMLEIYDFNCTMNSSSEAWIHSDGYISGSLSSRSRLYYTGSALPSVIADDNSDIISKNPY